MNLYTVTETSDKEYAKKTRYITAFSSKEAIETFIKNTNNNFKITTTIKAYYLCKREEIIPSVEPIKETN